MHYVHQDADLRSQVPMHHPGQTVVSRHGVKSARLLDHVIANGAAQASCTYAFIDNTTSRAYVDTDHDPVIAHVNMRVQDTAKRNADFTWAAGR